MRNIVTRTALPALTACAALSATAWAGPNTVSPQSNHLQAAAPAERTTGNPANNPAEYKDAQDLVNKATQEVGKMKQDPHLKQLMQQARASTSCRLSAAGH